MYRVNISSVQSFMQCRFRWWCEYVMNRVPVATSPALDAGRLLHRIFEEHFKTRKPLATCAREQCVLFRAAIPKAHPAAQPNALKAVEVIEDLIEAFPLWKDQVKASRTLEVEEPFAWPDPEVPGVLWVGRPDRVVVSNGRIWHRQNRGLAASMNFGSYLWLAKRNYHEHLYAEALADKYRGRKEPYGGTQFNLVRKLKYRTYVGKKNESVKSSGEMFWQQAITVNRDSPTHRAVMMAMRQHVQGMLRVEQEWQDSGIVPAPNEKMNGGFGGNTEDPYFKVLIGETTLEDDTVFKDREDMYADVPAD